MFELRISKRAEKQIKELKKEYQMEVINALTEIREEPLLGKPLDRDLNGRFSYRFASYRIIYNATRYKKRRDVIASDYKVNQKDKVVEILWADHRGRVYN